MKNILGKQEELELFNKEGKLIYRFYQRWDKNWCESTYDSNGNLLTFKDSTDYWSELTYDSNGNLLTFKDSNGVMRGFDIPEYTMEELVEKLGNFKIKK